MSVRATQWGWNQRIGPTSKLVLLELCDRVNEAKNGDRCWPSQRTIAARTGYTERTVNSALRELESAGLIKRERRSIHGQRTSDMITVNVTKTAMGPTSPSRTPEAKIKLDIPPAEFASGNYQKEVQVATGSNFCEIVNEEPVRLNQAVGPVFLCEFPEPGCPEIDARNNAIRTIEEIAPQLGTAIDWSAPGIENIKPVVTWLSRIKEDKFTSCLIDVAGRNRSHASEPIRSWAYFERELSKLLPSL